MDIIQTISKELNLQTAQTQAAIKLLDEGATVPFIARYRKEATGSLDDTQLRDLEERLGYLRELNERREVILKSIEEQGKLTDDLKAKILAAAEKARLEDLYLPYKPKRRTKAQIAIEAGLEPLANALLLDPTLTPESEAEKYLNEEKKVKTPQDALEGAKQILMERFAEDAELLAKLREYVWENALFSSKLIEGKVKEAAKFKDYFDFNEAIKKVPSHRALAILRGQKETFLRATVELTEDAISYCVGTICSQFSISKQSRAADEWLYKAVEWAWKVKIKLKLDLDLVTRLREAAEAEAIDVFKKNLGNLLMAAPAGHKTVLGLDPGLRTGVKAVVIDGTGKLLDYITIFPHAPKNQWEQSIHMLAAMCHKHKVNLISIGNGTASRETDKLCAELIKIHGDLKLTKIVVSEAGASVYSASKLAAQEFPDLDVSYRGAVSIARRLQDPLAELVKIDPKAIGVGQYQHDVNQVRLGKGLNAVLEDCVNSVGADINTASVPLLKSIAGLNETVAKNIIQFRDDNGRFTTRDQIKRVPRMGDKTFEQSVGFLRIINGDNPLDASSVHPESYHVVEKILQNVGQDVGALLGNTDILSKLKPKDFVSDTVGLPTVTDIIDELKKPGRDPRPEFRAAKFADGIETIKDLKENMILEGVVTNVTNFGAFVDIGVHQDGLVHISQLADKYVDDPSKVVKAGQIVKVKVLEVDVDRKRIQLTMRLQEGTMKGQQKQDFDRKPRSHSKQPKQKKLKQQNTAMGQALLEALGR